MSVATANVFDLLDDEGTVDVSALAAKIPQPKKEEPVKKAAETQTAPAARPDRLGRPTGGRGGRGPRPQRQSEDVANGPGGPEEAGAQRERGGRRGGYGGRGTGRGSYGRREFDRRDGTGRSHEPEKRSGGGRGNWGTDAEVAVDAIERVAVADPAEGERAAEGEEGAPRSDAARPARPPREEEPEDSYVSLEAFEKARAEKKAGLNKVREPAATADESQFSGMKSFAKAADVDELVFSGRTGKALAPVSGKARESKPKREQLTDLGFRHAAPGGEAPRGGRGGRGGRFEGGRGAGGRGAGGRGRGERAPVADRAPRPSAPKQQAPVALDDDSAFPSLS